MKKFSRYVVPNIQVHQITVNNLLQNASDPTQLNDNYEEKNVQESQKSNGYTWGL